MHKKTHNKWLYNKWVGPFFYFNDVGSELAIRTGILEILIRLQSILHNEIVFIGI